MDQPVNGGDGGGKVNGGGKANGERQGRDQDVLGLRSELTALEWRARRLGLEEVAHFAGIAAAIASEVIRSRSRKPPR